MTETFKITKMTVLPDVDFADVPPETIRRIAARLQARIDALARQVLLGGHPEPQGGTIWPPRTRAGEYAGIIRLTDVA